jgi:hypothetical protein
MSACRHWSRDDSHTAVLPAPGEHLVFGVHRLPCDERPCPATTGTTLADRRYAALLRAAKKDFAYLAAIAERQSRKDVPA